MVGLRSVTPSHAPGPLPLLQYSFPVPVRHPLCPHPFSGPAPLLLPSHASFPRTPSPVPLPCFSLSSPSSALFLLRLLLDPFPAPAVPVHWLFLHLLYLLIPLPLSRPLTWLLALTCPVTLCCITFALTSVLLLALSGHDAL